MHVSALGMSAAQSLFDLYAHNIANVSTARPASAPDPTGDVVGLITAQTTYTANATTLTVLAATERSLLDLRA